MTVSIKQYEAGLDRQHALEKAEAIIDRSPHLCWVKKIAWIREYFEDEWRAQCRRTLPDSGHRPGDL